MGAKPIQSDINLMCILCDFGVNGLLHLYLNLIKYALDSPIPLLFSSSTF